MILERRRGREKKDVFKIKIQSLQMYYGLAIFIFVNPHLLIMRYPLIAGREIKSKSHLSPFRGRY